FSRLLPYLSQQEDTSISHRGILVLLLGLSAAAAWGKGRDESAAPEEQYKALVKEYYEATNAYGKSVTVEERNRAAARVDKLPLRLLELAEKNPRNPVALDALIQAVAQEIWLEENASKPAVGKDSPGVRAIALMLRDHIRSDMLGEACRRIQYGFRK